MTITYDVLLDPTTGDLPLAPMIANDLNKVGQSATIASLLQAGEAIFDKTAGMLYIAWGQVKPYPLTEAGNFIKRTILGLDGVISMSQWEESFDVQTQTASYTGRFVVEDGSEFDVRVLPTGEALINSGALAYFTIVGLPGGI